MSKNPERQHIVPRMYLQHFATQQDGKYYIWYYDKNTGKSRNESIRNVLVQKNFYTYGTGEDRYRLEEWYASNETLCANVLKKIEINATCVLSNAHTPIINETDKLLISKLIGIQMSRGNLMKRKVKQYYDYYYPILIDSLIQQLKDANRFEVADYATNKFDEAFKVKLFKDIWIESLENLSYDRYASLISQGTWHFYVTMDDVLVTSDEPVIVVNQRSKRYGFLESGLLDPFTVIAFPISSRILLFIYNSVIYKQLDEVYDCSKIMISSASETVINNNIMQLLHANRYVLYKNEM